jgi:NTP pyrophosphatase (non-canonical NTP hydrolase)
MSSKELIEYDKLIYLRFFRDLSNDERLKMLKVFDLIPQDYTGYLQEAVLRMLLTKLLQRQRERQTVAVPDGYFYEEISGSKGSFLGPIHDNTKWHVEHNDLKLTPFWLSAAPPADTVKPRPVNFGAIVDALEGISNDIRPEVEHLAKLIYAYSDRLTADTEKQNTPTSEQLAFMQPCAQLRAQANDVSLFDLRIANIERDKEWGQGQEFGLSYRGNELAGETGEACNVLKKLDRERMGLVGSRATVEEAADELADVIICADLAAMELGIDLGQAVSRKFNKTTEKYGLKTRLGPG